MSISLTELIVTHGVYLLQLLQYFKEQSQEQLLLLLVIFQELSQQVNLYLVLVFLMKLLLLADQALLGL